MSKVIDLRDFKRNKLKVAEDDDSPPKLILDRATGKIYPANRKPTLVSTDNRDPLEKVRISIAKFNALLDELKKMNQVFHTPSTQPVIKRNILIQEANDDGSSKGK